MEFMEKRQSKMTTVVKIAPGKRKEFLDAMGSLRDHKLKEKGITTSDWHEDCHDPNRFHIMEEWESEEDLMRYCRTDMFRIFLGALKTLCVEADVGYEPHPGEPKRKVLAKFPSEDGRFAEI